MVCKSLSQFLANAFAFMQDKKHQEEDEEATTMTTTTTTRNEKLPLSGGNVHQTKFCNQFVSELTLVLFIRLFFLSYCSVFLNSFWSKMKMRICGDKMWSKWRQANKSRHEKWKIEYFNGNDVKCSSMMFSHSNKGQMKNLKMSTQKNVERTSSKRKGAHNTTSSFLSHNRPHHRKT